MYKPKKTVILQRKPKVGMCRFYGINRVFINKLNMAK